MAMEMRGSLNVSKFQKTSAQPRFYGRALINGVSYEIKGWEKSNNGEPWISLLFEAEGEPFEQAKPAQSLFSTETIRTVNHPVFKDDDDIPF